MRILPLILITLTLLWQPTIAGNTVQLTTKDASKGALMKKLYFKDGDAFDLDLYTTQGEQERGLSVIKNYPDNRGAFFYYPNDGVRQFWMPDTYIDLDLYFLDKDLKVVFYTQLNKHPGHNEPPAIERSPSVLCRYVLEVLAGTKLSKKIQLEQQLFFDPPKKAK